MTNTDKSAPEPADTLIAGAVLVTLDAGCRIISDGALAIRGDRIVGVGASRDIAAGFAPREFIDGRRFVVTPGFIDAHIHITGDPLTRGYVPDDLDAGIEERFSRWVMPRFLAHSAADEHLSAQLAALQMLRSGTTCFLEAGTIRHLDAVIDGLARTGIRGRVGAWIEGRVHDGGDPAAATDRAVRALEDQMARHPGGSGAKVAAWPLLVGHATNTDEVWQAAKRLAERHDAIVSAHMSPYPSDPDWYLAHCGRRPIEHLAHIGVLGSRLSLTHVVHLDRREVELLAATGTNAVVCPLAALRGAFGLARIGRFPEMRAAGIPMALGTDGGSSDLMPQMALASALFKDTAQDGRIFGAHEVLAMATAGAARLMNLQHEIGSLEPGKKADFVLHDTDRPEWRPFLNPLHQLVWSADGRSVHSVWVDGVRVVDDYRSTLLDESELYRRVQEASRGLLARSGVPARCAWLVT
ncbi:MAG: amidohydrolase family protein [Gammaproteobacteria bacterium]